MTSNLCTLAIILVERWAIRQVQLSRSTFSSLLYFFPLCKITRFPRNCATNTASKDGPQKRLTKYHISVCPWWVSRIAHHSALGLNKTWISQIVWRLNNPNKCRSNRMTHDLLMVPLYMRTWDSNNCNWNNLRVDLDYGNLCEYFIPISRICPGVFGTNTIRYDFSRFSSTLNFWVLSHSRMLNTSLVTIGYWNLHLTKHLWDTLLKNCRLILIQEMCTK